MNATLSDALLKTVLMAASFCCAALLLRAGSAAGLHVPLDPNEGWNAYHALAAMSGQDLYPRTLMVNNYPPLSFYVVGLLGKPLGDYIIAGRLVSLASFLTIAMGLAALIRQIGGTVLDGIFAALLFAAALSITSNYVGMNDPQLLGHALQIQALLLLWRERPALWPAALLLAAGLFVKQNLFVLPLAALLWLALQDHARAIRFALYGIGFGLAGLLAGAMFLHVNILAELAAPRIWNMANLKNATLNYLSWATLPLLLTAWTSWRLRYDPWMRFCAFYAAIALAAGIGFSAGDGVDANIFFDLDIAMALGVGVALGRLPATGRGLLAFLYTLPLALFLARNFHDGNFAYTEGFQKQAPLDSAFIAVRPGPALCEMLSLCYWAGKPAEADMFNLSEQFKTGTRSDDALAGLIRAHYFQIVQLDSLDAFPLGAKVHAAMNAAYRVDHIDDNGVFLVPR